MPGLHADGLAIGAAVAAGDEALGAAVAIAMVLHKVGSAWQMLHLDVLRQVYPVG